jgi:hypothetical protein
MSETYECIRPDKGFRFISEKVSHHPLIIACHAESKRYKYWTSTKVKSKFWGKSMEFMTEGTFHVLLTETGDHFTFSKPSSWMRNMIAGEKYIEHVGEVKLKNHNTGDYAMISFKEGTGRGIFSAPKDKNNVVCTLYNQQDVKCKRLVGKWSGHISEDINMEGHTFSVLWKVTPPRNPDFEKYYGFTEFAVELNEITPIEETKLQKTDSRYRPDQRLYEEGHSEEAEKEKLRIEAKQRETRKVIADQGLTWEPCWFKLETDDYTETSLHPEPMDVPYTWQFSGEYWKIRESRQWPKNQPDLW